MAKLTFFTFRKVDADASAHPISFVIALAMIIIWAAAGPMFSYSDRWQLVINTGTTTTRN
jgi:low affinity Fe/Cu permease